MILDILLVLVLAGMALAWRRWRRLAGTCFALALALLLAAGCGPLPRLMLHDLQDGYPTGYDDWGTRNAIVLLGAGTIRTDGDHVEMGLFAHDRMLRAAMLYHGCKTHGGDCRILASGGDATGLAVSEASLYARQLQRLGVPATDVMLEPDSRNTWQNARFSAPLLRDYAPNRVVLVSSGTHLRRASLYFHHFGVPATAVRADYLAAALLWRPDAWNLAVTDVALHEYLGIAQYYVYGFMGWNAAATAPAHAAPARAGTR